MSDALIRAARLRLIGFDVDGTLTDGSLYIGPQGEGFKRFSVRDGLGLVRLREAGIRVVLVTGRRSEIVLARARELGIETVLQGVGDKGAAIASLCAQAGVTLEEAGFMGDDWPDLPAMTRVGFAATVADAPGELLAVAHWIARAPAGGGAARELAEYVLRAQGRALAVQTDGRAA